jgi:hypothetical protein
MPDGTRKITNTTINADGSEHIEETVVTRHTLLDRRSHRQYGRAVSVRGKEAGTGRNSPALLLGFL